MTSEEAKKHIEHIRTEKFGIAPNGTKHLSALGRDLRQALKILAEELNTKETHFILELLQNAEDNTYPQGATPELSLHVEPTDPTGTPKSEGCVCLLNNELGFQPDQVLSLCSLGQSTKEDKRKGYIGEKGIGFKSVFRICDRPHIFSNGYQFCFQKPEGPDDLGYIVPHWVEDIPPVVRKGFTAILLPLADGKREGFTQQLLAILPETILFLTKIRRLSVGAERSVSRDGTSGFVTLSSDGQHSLYFVHREIWAKHAALVEAKRPGISEREVTVALPLKCSGRHTGRVFAYLPTEFDSGLPFLVNADFLLSASRESVLENRIWNQWLRNCVAPTFAKAFLLLLKSTEWRANAYRLLPISSDLSPGADFFAPLVESAQRTLQTQDCILTTAGVFTAPHMPPPRRFRTNGLLRTFSTANYRPNLKKGQPLGRGSSKSPVCARFQSTHTSLAGFCRGCASRRVPRPRPVCSARLTWSLQISSTLRKRTLRLWKKKCLGFLPTEAFSSLKRTMTRN